MKEHPTVQGRPLFEPVLILIFVASLGLPLFSALLGTAIRGDDGTSDKRKAHRPPAWPATWSATWQYPAKLSAYYRDHFGLRSVFIRAHARLIYGLFRTSPSRLVLAGREGWFYYADDYSLEDYRSLVPFSDAELARWKQVLEARQAWLARHGIRFLVVLCCDKHVIYPEYLPAGVERRRDPFRVEVLADFLSRQTSIPVVSFKPELEAAKQSGRIYHRTDSHWNDAGAYVGYHAILTRLGEWFPAVKPMPPESFTLQEVETPGWDLAVMMKLQDVIREQDRQLVPKAVRPFRVTKEESAGERWNSGRIVTETDDEALPSAVVFRDSFGSALVPFLARHFRRGEFLWQYEFDASRVLAAKPDVVIFLMTSRRLQWYVPENPPLE